MPSMACQCPLWVKSGHRAWLKECLLYPQKQTLELGREMSALVMAASDRAIRVGGVMPLSRPGFLEAGRHLKAWTRACCCRRQTGWAVSVGDSARLLANRARPTSRRTPGRAASPAQRSLVRRRCGTHPQSQPRRSLWSSSFMRSGTNRVAWNRPGARPDPNDVCFWHKADIAMPLRKFPLSGVK
jgi:hypothetical protein